MPFVKIRVHAIWGTKNTEPVLSQDVRPLLFQYMKEFAWQNEFSMDFISGYYDHVHCLFTLSKNLSIEKTIQMLKDESAHWANQRTLVKPKLTWSKEYLAISVSESLFDDVMDFLKNQDTYHQKINFIQEYKTLMKDHYFLSSSSEEEI